MVENCCKLVNTINTQLNGIISISSRGKTEVRIFRSGTEATAVTLPSIGTVSISAYASNEIHTGCPGRAGVSINWIRKCGDDKYTFMYSGAGNSFKYGGVPSELITFPTLSIQGLSNPVATIKTMNASASSGPTSLYEDYTQEDGYGLIYKGGPFAADIDTTDESTTTINLSDFGGFGDCILQSLNLQCTPGQLPVVNMEFVYNIEN